MDELSYTKQTEIKLTRKIREHQKKLPEFTKDFVNFYEQTKKCSKNTVLNYIYDLELFFYFLEKNNPKCKNNITLDIINSLTSTDIQEYIDFLDYYEKDGKTYSNDECGISRKLSSLRSFYKYYNNIRAINNNPMLLIPFPKKHKKQIIRLDTPESEMLMQSVYSGSALTENQQKYAAKFRYRDIAIINLFLGTGIRVSELVGINLKDVNFNNNSILVRRKGGNEELVFFNEHVKENLLDYINLERSEYQICDQDINALFISRKHRRISVRSVERIVEKYTEPIIDNKNITPHKLRSTYGTNLYRASGDIYLTADALGHSNISVTASHYADIGEEKRKSAATYTKGWVNS